MLTSNCFVCFQLQGCSSSYGIYLLLWKKKKSFSVWMHLLKIEGKTRNWNFWSFSDSSHYSKVHLLSGQVRFHQNKWVLFFFLKFLIFNVFFFRKDARCTHFFCLTWKRICSTSYTCFVVEEFFLWGASWILSTTAGKCLGACLQKRW